MRASLANPDARRTLDFGLDLSDGSYAGEPFDPRECSISRLATRRSTSGGSRWGEGTVPSGKRPVRRAIRRARSPSTSCEGGRHRQLWRRVGVQRIRRARLDVELRGARESGPVRRRRPRLGAQRDRRTRRSSTLSMRPCASRGTASSRRARRARATDFEARARVTYDSRRAKPTCSSPARPSISAATARSPRRDSPRRERSRAQGDHDHP